ncbi:hypothetical protein V500_04593 [Pseudogymnoascus sp. VKM F-4518 (FW-2643)]|nr:hypothetical protein V500_04593 [Pseudogymnoascus sp. VKM F-4518 (FW-2643)]
MHFSILALSVALVAPLVSAYPISGTSVNCRSGPATSYKVIKTYKKGQDVKITCQTVGETVSGDNLWDKTSDGCYVADYYVKTGTTGRVVKTECKTGGSGDSTTNGKITRKEIIARAKYWIDRHVPYSMSGYYPDPKGTKYRTDCSGFVAMSLHASAPGYSTVDLPRIGKQIAWKDLQPGDFVGTLGPGTGGANGHVTLFLSWTDKTKKAYNTLECRGKAYGCVAFTRKVGWKDGSFTSKPYKYIHVV